MNRIRLVPDYDALLVPKQIAIITESVQALNDICVSLETENAAIRMAAAALPNIYTILDQINFTSECKRIGMLIDKANGCELVTREALFGLVQKFYETALKAELETPKGKEME